MEKVTCREHDSGSSREGENCEHASRSGRGSEWVVIRVVFVYMNNISSVYNFPSM